MVPLIFLALGLGLLWDAKNFIDRAERTSGMVIDVRRNVSDDSVSYTPTIRYQRADGQTFEAVTHISSSNYDYAVGSRVDILYSYDDSSEVRIDSFFSLYGIGAIFATIGALFIGVGMWAGRKGAVAVGEAASRVTLPGSDPWSAESAKRKTTDPSQPGHVHEPKPKQPSAVQRMR